jgi:predicted secreted acid phosphatase
MRQPRVSVALLLLAVAFALGCAKPLVNGGAAQAPRTNPPPFGCETLKPDKAQLLNQSFAAAHVAQRAQVLEAATAAVKASATPPGWAIVDLDETLLDNSLYFACHNEHTPATWVQWIRAAAAPVFPQALPLVQALQASGRPFAYLSGRKEPWRYATLQNLAAVGLPTQGVPLLLKPSNTPSTTTAAQYKSQQRCALQAQSGLPVTLSVGDQLSDNAGECAAPLFFHVPNLLYTLP